MLNWFSAPLAPFTWKPPSISPEFTDGDASASDWKVRAFGRRSNSSAVTLCAIEVRLVSINGAASVTWTVSATEPTVSAPSTFSRWPTIRLTSASSYF